MTGFGSAEGKVGVSGVSIEVRTVNHRFFNPSIKLPTAFAKWEGEVREVCVSVSRADTLLSSDAWSGNSSADRESTSSVSAST
jgi:Uncharacterized stress-induced protein